MTDFRWAGPRVWVVGSINQDIVAYGKRLPAPGETVLAASGGLFPGGKGANQAVAAARLGACVSMIGRVGRDAFGVGLTAFLSAQGVDTSGVSEADDVATGMALIAVDEDADNSIVVVPGANARWDQGLASFAPERGDVVVCQFEIPLQVIREVFRIARRVRARTVLNPSPYISSNRLLDTVDVLVVNEVEAVQTLEEPHLAIDDASLGAAAGRLARRVSGAAILTAGARGAFVAKGARVAHVRGVPVQAIDTTGAGDCFTGALVAELARGVDAFAAAEFAVQAAAISVTRRGAAASFPRLEEIA